MFIIKWKIQFKLSNILHSSGISLLLLKFKKKKSVEYYENSFKILLIRYYSCSIIRYINRKPQG